MGEVVIVTGASRGIGAATAELAAARGWAVGVNYRERAAEAEAVVSRIKAGGGLAVALRGDTRARTMCGACSTRPGLHSDR